MTMDQQKMLTCFLVSVYVILSFILVSLKQTYQLTSYVFNGGKVNNKWGPETLNAGMVVHGLVLLLLLWLPMLISGNYKMN